MSELNNKEVKEKKNNSYFIFLILFTIIAISITIVAIYLTNNKEQGNTTERNTITDNTILNEKNSNKLSENLKKEAKMTVSLTDTYQTNAIEIKYYWYLDGKIKTDEEIEQMEEFDEEDYEKCARFVQIEGLKNKTIQENINQEIKQKMITILNRKQDVYIYVVGNFANALSIEFSIRSSEDYMTEGLNYRLDTGEKIKFEDLFVNKAYAKTVLTQAIYEKLSWKYTGSDEGGTNVRADKMDYTKVDVDAFEMMQDYLKNPDIEFYFGPSEINAFINNEMVTVEMEKFSQYIAIYKKYTGSKKIYEDEDKGYKGLYVFSSRITEDYHLFYYQFEQMTDNLFVDIWLYDQDNTGKKDKMIRNMEKVLNEMKEEAKKNPKKAYIFTYFTYGDDENLQIMKYEMEKAYFDKYGKELIAEANRTASIFDGSADIEVYYHGNESEKKNITPYIYKNDKFITEEEYNQQV